MVSCHHLIHISKHIHGTLTSYVKLLKRKIGDHQLKKPHKYSPIILFTSLTSTKKLISLILISIKFLIRSLPVNIFHKNASIILLMLNNNDIVVISNKTSSKKAIVYDQISMPSGYDQVYYFYASTCPFGVAVPLQIILRKFVSAVMFPVWKYGKV